MWFKLKYELLTIQNEKISRHWIDRVGRDGRKPGIEHGKQRLYRWRF